MGWLLEEVGGAGGGEKLVLMGINIRGGGVEGLHGVYEVSNTDVVHREDVTSVVAASLGIPGVWKDSCRCGRGLQVYFAVRWSLRSTE